MSFSVESYTDKLLLKYTDSNNNLFESVVTELDFLVQKYCSGKLSIFRDLIKEYNIIERGTHCILKITIGDKTGDIILKNEKIVIPIEEPIKKDDIFHQDDHITFNRKKLILFEEKFTEIQEELVKTRSEYSQFQKDANEIDFARNEITKMQMELLTKNIQKLDSICVFVESLDKRINEIDQKLQQNIQNVQAKQEEMNIRLVQVQNDSGKIGNDIVKISNNITEGVSEIKSTMVPLNEVSTNVKNIKSSIEPFKEIPKISKSVETISKSLPPIKNEIEKVTTSLDLQLVTIESISTAVVPLKKEIEKIPGSLNAIGAHFEPLKKNLDQIDLKLNYLDSSLWLFPNIVGPIDKISPDSQDSMCAMFSLKLLTRNYVGPIVRIRSGNRFQYFYADEEGNMGTELHGKGQKLRDWLGNNVANIEIWFDQSGKEQHARQELFRSQPIIDVERKCIQFGTGRYFLLTNQTVPSKYSSQTIIVKHHEIRGNNAVFFGLKQDTPEPLPDTQEYIEWIQKRMNFNMLEKIGGKYKNELGDNETFEFGEFKNNNVVTLRKTKKSIQSFSNCIQSVVKKRINEQIIQEDSFCTDYAIGLSVDKHNTTYSLEGELSFLYFFNSCITDIDRLIAESG